MHQTAHAARIHRTIRCTGCSLESIMLQRNFRQSSCKKSQNTCAFWCSSWKFPQIRTYPSGAKRTRVRRRKKLEFVQVGHFVTRKGTPKERRWLWISRFLGSFCILTVCGWSSRDFLRRVTNWSSGEPGRPFARIANIWRTWQFQPPNVADVALGDKHWTFLSLSFVLDRETEFLSFAQTKERTW